jgi:GTPase SAR1 family protein
METIDAFKKQQSQTIDALKRLFVFLQEGEQFGVEVDPKFKLKLETGIRTTANEKLKVVLIGGFSEGKTSIAAAWAEKYDKSSMKISQQESSDEVVKYSMDDFDLIDTPGLFGFKETADKEKYKDITRKYISEAHLVLYVMNPNNPIKESHREELRWLFNDLNLLSRTIFVLSRFDEEVDIEDDNEYRNGFEIKRRNIIARLKDLDILTNDDISIVAISANPFGKGIDYWLSHLDDFKKLSHIESLQKATTDKITASGNSNALVEASRKSIIHDIILRQMPAIIERDDKISRECDRFSLMCTDTERELENTKENLSRTRITLREFITDLFKDLILQARGVDKDTITDFFEHNIGSEGIVLESKIKNEFERQLCGTSGEINRMKISLDSAVQQYNNVIGEFAITSLKQGSQFLKSSVNITASGVKTVRNFIMPSFKFRPFGTIRLAGKLNKTLPIIGSIAGIALDAWELWDQNKKDAKFKEVIIEIVSNLEKQRKEYLELINDDIKFIQKFFPDYNDLKNEIDILKAEMQAKESQREKFRQWREQGDIIEAEFETIS